MEKRALKRNRIAGYSEIEEETIRKNRVAGYSEKGERIEGVNRDMFEIGFLNLRIIKYN